jgi:ATP-dependent protease Clp ATPase subunit
MTKAKNQLKEISEVFRIFKTSNGTIRPHFILTGPSGSGKSYNINTLAKEYKVGFLEINAAQLTKEGTSGNSLSKALAPIVNMNSETPKVVFVDEFDKLFISGNSNSQLAHESTNGVQNEFLKILESDTASVYGDFGKYINIDVSNVLFVFAGAFNGAENIGIDKLRSYGIKTEFIGRTGLVYNLSKLSLNSLRRILDKSDLFERYSTLFDLSEDKISKAKDIIFEFVEKNYENNTLGARLINTLIHQYFIKKGDLSIEEVKTMTFQEKLEF